MGRHSCALLVATVLTGAFGCPSPTLTLATQQPIEIRIDLRHEVRVHIDREVGELIESESEREKLIGRGGGAAEEKLVRDAKRRGAVGEQADGTLGLRAGASTAERELVARVNEERAGEYRALAAEHGAPLQEIAKLAGARRIRAAEPGEWVRLPDGAWVDAERAQVVVVEGETGARVEVSE